MSSFIIEYHANVFVKPSLGQIWMVLLNYIEILKWNEKKKRENYYGL